jgi:tetratricopeptide (TPR) repeat protein
MLAKEAAFGWLLGMPLFFMYRPENAEVSETPKTDNIRSELYLFAAYYGAAFFAALLFRSFWLVLAISASYLLHTLIRMKGCTVDNAIPRGVRRRLILILISLALMATLFLIVRRIVFISDIRRIGQTISLMGEDLNYSFSMFLGAAGFYMKKFLVPFPLNFFIREIDPLYDFLGIAALLAALRCFVSTRLPANFVLSGFFVMLPALPFVFGTIAWTAYAERYIYLATAFWIVALSLWTGRWMNLSPKRIPFITGCVVILCLAMAGVTFSRNLVWLTNVDLMADTVAKNPQRRILRDIYMYSLLAAGRLEEAKREYGISRSIHDTFYDDKADLVMGNELNREGRSKEALRLYQDAIERSKYRSEGLLAAGIEQVRKVREAGPISAEERRHLSELELEYEGRLLEITRTPQRLIEAGRRASQRGAACEASSLFDEALHKLSRHERLYPVAESLLKETRN